jgi:hypothetical protein
VPAPEPRPQAPTVTEPTPAPVANVEPDAAIENKNSERKPEARSTAHAD